MKKMLSLVLALCMALSMGAVAWAEGAETAQSSEYGVDYISLYEQFGKNVTIADVREDEATGLAYATFDGTEYELGLDFLTMAMVYNTQPCGEYATEEEVYTTWWRLYIQRWNALMPEIPLYANEFYQVYNAQIQGVQEHPVTPYWTAANALVYWTSEKEDNSIILGNGTELSGLFRYAAFDSVESGAADRDIELMTLGLETISTTPEGMYVWNDTVVKHHEETENADGSKTYTITIHDDLKLSDGTPVTAKNYLVGTLVFATPVAMQMADMQAMTIQGYDQFSAYDGVVGQKEMVGLRLLDEYTFSVTIDAAYLPYYYDITYAHFVAQDLGLWLGDADIADDGNGAYLTEEFYATNEDGTYVMAEHIRASAMNTDTTYPYSGPYMVTSYDEMDHSAVLEINPFYKGNYEGVKPSIARVIYKQSVPETQLQELQSGNVDVISGLASGEEIDEALALADASDGGYGYTCYSRAGYGKLGFRADYGPVQFAEVRRAIAYCMDRPTFAKEATGGYGSVLDGPYYTGSWMYQAAVEQGMMLETYPASLESAIAELEAGGWVYDKDGNAYVEGVRYKKIPADQATENDITYRSRDGAYTTTLVNGDYYMPLVLNWYGTAENPFTDQLMTGFAENEYLQAAGFQVQVYVGDFAAMVDELYQAEFFGFYSGTPMYCAFNYGTDFDSAAYDESYKLTIDPAMFEQTAVYFIRDAADFYWLH